MSQPLIVRSAAQADIRDAYDYLEEVRPGLGDLFSARLREAFERIETNPLSCGAIWQDVRAVRTRRSSVAVTIGKLKSFSS